MVDVRIGVELYQVAEGEDGVLEGHIYPSVCFDFPSSLNSVIRMLASTFYESFELAHSNADSGEEHQCKVPGHRRAIPYRLLHTIYAALTQYICNTPSPLVSPRVPIPVTPNPKHARHHSRFPSVAPPPQYKNEVTQLATFSRTLSLSLIVF